MSRVPFEQMKAIFRPSPLPCPLWFMLFLLGRGASQTQPSGLPSPEMWATFLAGPLGNKANISLVVIPAPVVMVRSVGALPESLALRRQNSMTFQWASVSSGIPSCWAIATAISRVHCPGSVRKPSSLTATGFPAIVRVSMLALLILRSLCVGGGFAIGGLSPDDVQD